MQLDTPMKKEVARWYWLMMAIVNGEFNLLEEIWRECLPEPQFKDLWQAPCGTQNRFRAIIPPRREAASPESLAHPRNLTLRFSLPGDLGNS
ncbi:hypothetical protein NDU88_003708 [Pleurodeles waltl]|uniref:Uncharacterized protein n=1 Tax=Pleurodeles waltl TaxID=8319 RepID=A0AAV7UZ90_PLEWA|nr:hypothetical protein NDU88_003708 [Pleurodeles waltl]